MLVFVVGDYHLVEDIVQLVDLSFLLHILDSLFLPLIHPLQLNLRKLHQLPLLMLSLLNPIILQDRSLYPLNIHSRPNNIFKILQKPRLLAIARFLPHLRNLLNLALQYKETVVI